MFLPNREGREGGALRYDGGRSRRQSRRAPEGNPRPARAAVDRQPAAQGVQRHTRRTYSSPPTLATNSV